MGFSITCNITNNCVDFNYSFSVRRWNDIVIGRLCWYNDNDCPSTNHFITESPISYIYILIIMLFIMNPFTHATVSKHNKQKNNPMKLLLTLIVGIDSCSMPCYRQSISSPVCGNSQIRIIMQVAISYPNIMRVLSVTEVMSDILGKHIGPSIKFSHTPDMLNNQPYFQS